MKFIILFLFLFIFIIMFKYFIDFKNEICE